MTPPGIVEAVFSLLMLAFALLPVALLIFLFVKINRMERKLDGVIERLRDIQAGEHGSFG